MENRSLLKRGRRSLKRSRDNEIYIPSLCYHRKTHAASKMSSLCGRSRRNARLQTSCSVEATDGMKRLPRCLDAVAAVKMVINLLLANGHHNCLSREANGDCELQDAAYYLGIEVPAFSSKRKRRSRDESSGIYCHRSSKKCINARALRPTIARWLMKFSILIQRA